MFRLPKECVTGHVEGWMDVTKQTKLTVLRNIRMLHSDSRPEVEKMLSGVDSASHSQFSIDGLLPPSGRM